MKQAPNETSPRKRPWWAIFRRRSARPPREWAHWQTHLWPSDRTPAHAFIVHGKCADGFTSAALLLSKYPDGMALYCQSAELLERLRHAARNPPTKHLILADVSPQPAEQDELANVLCGIAARCKVTWLDHHAPQWSPEMERRLAACGVELIVDHTRQESGASLVAKWVKVKDPRLLRVADLVRRRDAWVDPQNRHARAWVAVAGARRREYVEAVALGTLEGLEEEGLRLVDKKDLRVERLLRRRVKAHSPEVRWQWLVDDVSDVAERLFDSSPEAALLLRFGPRGTVSVRTRHGKDVAATLAQGFGGGGHANAAGFTLKLTTSQRLLYRLLRGHDRASRFVRRRAQELITPNNPQ